MRERQDSYSRDIYTVRWSLPKKGDSIRRFLLILIILALFGLLDNQAAPQSSLTSDETQKPAGRNTNVVLAESLKDTEFQERPLLQPVQVAPVERPTPSGAKAFIYMKESGNRTDAINPSSGACGLGQALPCSKMPCSLQDYACQDNYFTNYMLSRYGSWEAAASFWKCTGQCTSKYGTVYKKTTWW